MDFTEELSSILEFELPKTYNRFVVMRIVDFKSLIKNTSSDHFSEDSNVVNVVDLNTPLLRPPLDIRRITTLQPDVDVVIS